MRDPYEEADSSKCSSKGTGNGGGTSGKTLQVGLNVSAGIIGGVNISTGLAVSSSSSVPFDIGPYFTVGGGLQTPALSAGIEVIGTNANSITTLRGAGTTTGLSYGEAFTGGVDFVDGSGYSGGGVVGGVGLYAPAPFVTR